MQNVIYQSKHKTVYVEDGMIVKEFDETFPKADILNEALNQARVEETELNIPKISSVSVKDGKCSICMDFIPGKLLSELMAEDPAKTDEYLTQMVELQMEVHKQKVAMLPRLKDKMSKKIAQTAFSDTVKFELDTRIQAMPKHLKLCHGDFCPENIIITPESKAYIIDWAHATQGNASCDVARTFLKFSVAGKQELADKYLDLFCQKTGTQKSYVQGLLPVVAASYSLKCGKEEKALIEKWVDVADYE